MIKLKTQEEIEIIREGGAILSRILTELVAMARPGITTGELDAHAEKRMREAGGEPAFKGYRTDPDVRPFASTVCISLDDEVVHAPAVPSRVVPTGSLLKLDIGLKYKGLFTDMAVTVPIGEVTPEALKLIAVTKASMLAGIAKAIPGGRLGDIGAAIQGHVEAQGFSVVRELVGHGIGRRLHEPPQIPNFGRRGRGELLRAGMVLAIEPMVNAGEDEVRMKRDGWTVVTADGSLSAHYEVTIAITEDGMEILTPVPENA